MVKSKVWKLKSKYQGTPKLSDFEMIEEVLPDKLGKGEILCEVLHLTVDPYMRLEMFLNVGEPLFGENIAKVTVSENKDYPVGTILRTYTGWRTHVHLKDTQTVPPSPFGLPMFSKVPKMDDIPLSAALGILGMPGWTAYFGLLDICQPKEGETVVVNSAAGAVGSVVGQIAKAKGCKAIGYAGTEEKCKWLKSLGFDEAFNYKTEDLDKTLKKAASDGVDCYFDNVGGDFTDTVLNHMKLLGRVSICGQISSLNSSEPRKVPSPFMSILLKQLKIEGFLFARFQQRIPEAHNALLKWTKEGKIKNKESVTKGFENMPKAFIGLFDGSSFGKAIVNVK